MRQIFALLQRIAPTDSTVLLVGETGSGKGAAAKAIHKLSPRSPGPLVVFDCASVSDSLIESELFGHEKGAFTGAVGQRIGCLERANGGTLFLDEIDDLALDLQPKLLRAIEDREFRRLGSSTPISFDARIIVASKKDLWAETQAGRFREDLYFRLSVFTFSLPALRDRKEDIPLLVDAFAGEGLWTRLPEKIREQFTGHTWPGNVRELRNAIERARLLSRDGLVRAEDLNLPAPSRAGLGLDEPGREAIEVALRRYAGNVTRAAQSLGLSRQALYRRIERLDLRV
jgi:DNA-binding NtrC family response regulator